MDFDGNGASTRDSLAFEGYGTAAQGATFVNVGNDWQITSFDGSVQETITLGNGASIHTSDSTFI